MAAYMLSADGYVTVAIPPDFNVKADQTISDIVGNGTLMNISDMLVSIHNNTLTNIDGVDVKILFVWISTSSI
jgi:hypothetical protein